MTGLWGLLFNIDPLIKLAHEMATHPGRTLATIEQVLHKQFASLTNIRKMIVCEPYSGGNLSGVALVILATTVGTDGVGDAADLGNVAKELDDVAKAAAKDGTLEAQIVTTAADAKQIGEDVANGKTVIVKDLKALSNKRIGDLGEGYVIGELKKQGFDQVVQIQNASGNGVDIIARNPDGEVKVIEVKTTTGNSAPSLSEDQKTLGGSGYTKSRLARAKSGAYGPTAHVQALQAERWIQQAGEQGKLSYEVQPVYLRQGDGGVVMAKLGPSRNWP